MEENIFKSFEDLECWKACRELRLFVMREVIPLMPGNEVWRLSDQIIRAGRSTTSNIAEGYGRYHFLDNAKFCSNARGSYWEVLDHLIAAHDEEMIPGAILQKGRVLVNRAVKLINGYMKYLQEASRRNSPATQKTTDM